MSASIAQNVEANARYIFPNLMWSSLADKRDELLKRIKVTATPYSAVIYDQWDPTWGITPLRGLGGIPVVTSFPNYQRYAIVPGYWGESGIINESNLTTGIEPGSLADPVAVETYAIVAYDHFKSRITSLVRQVLCDTLRTGITVQSGASSNGQIPPKFSYQLSNYASQLLVPVIPWHSSASTANPLTDFLTWKAQLQRGSSNLFGAGSIALMNSLSIVDLFLTNAIFSVYKGPYGASIFGMKPESNSNAAEAAAASVLPDINDILKGAGLPGIGIYDLGYYPTQVNASSRTTSTWNYHIPYQSAIWIGERDEGQTVGEFQMTKHIGNYETTPAKRYPNASDLLEKWDGVAALEQSLYFRVHYQNRQPHQYELECGFNGSPLIGYPGGVAGIAWS